MSQILLTLQAALYKETFAKQGIPAVIKDENIFEKIFDCEAHKFHFECLF
jgi:hypothetical protein